MGDRIFISYRREDHGWARSLRQELVARFSRERVFRDVDDIGGERYLEKIHASLAETSICLVIIGEGWLELFGEKEASGEPDVLLDEVATALGLDDVRVVPVLVDGATMPAARDLPERISELAAWDAWEIPIGRYTDVAIEQLLDMLARLSGGAAEAAADTTPDETPAQQGDSTSEPAASPPPPAPADGARRQVVSARGDADRTTIAEAVRHAAPGGTVVVLPGTYDEPVVIERDVEIVAEGERDEVLVRVGSAQTAITVERGDVRIRGLTVIAGATGDAVLVRGGAQARVEDCDLSTRAGKDSEKDPCALAVTGATTRATVRRSRLHHGHFGALGLNGGELVLEQVAVDQNIRGGVLVQSGASVEVRDSEVHDNGLSGLTVRGESSRGLVTGTEVVGNDGLGVAVFDGCSLTVQHSSVERQTKGGVHVEASTADLSQCRLSANVGYGVGVMGPEGHASLRACTVSDQERNGIEASDRATCTVHGGAARDNGKAGVLAASGARITCTGLLAEGNGTGDLVELDGATLEGTDVTVGGRQHRSWPEPASTAPPPPQAPPAPPVPFPQPADAPPPGPPAPLQPGPGHVLFDPRAGLHVWTASWIAGMEGDPLFTTHEHDPALGLWVPRLDEKRPDLTNPWSAVDVSRPLRTGGGGMLGKVALSLLGTSGKWDLFDQVYDEDLGIEVVVSRQDNNRFRLDQGSNPMPIGWPVPREHNGWGVAWQADGKVWLSWSDELDGWAEWDVEYGCWRRSQRGFPKGYGG